MIINGKNVLSTMILAWVMAILPVYGVYAEEPLAPDFAYTVLVGDNLTIVRDQLCSPAITVKQIATYNKVANPNFIRPGQSLLIPTNWLKAKVLPIQLLVFTGDVTIQKKHAAKAVALTAQHAINEGDKLFTGSKGIVKIRFADESVLNLQPNASLEILSSRQRYHSDKMEIEVGVNQGRVEVLANPEHQSSRQFKVKTPSAVAVVRGTEFRVGAASDKTIEETIKGKVDLAVNADTVQVEKGYGSYAQAGSPPKPPVLLPPEPLTAQLATRFDNAPVAFAFPAQEGVKAVIAQVYQTDALSNLLETQRSVLPTGDAQTVQFGALEDGKYYLRLRAEDAQGLQSQDVVHAFEVDLYPLPPKPETSLGNFTASAGSPLQWSRMKDYDQYTVQVAEQATFDQVLFEKNVFYNSFYFTQQMAPNAKFWRVGIQTETGNLKFSKPQKLIAGE